jgi:hypothetical protein
MVVLHDYLGRMKRRAFGNGSNTETALLDPTNEK